MDNEARKIETQVLGDHWWFVGRRALLSRFLDKAGIDRKDLVVDLGTGSGTNLKMLSAMGFQHVLGLEFDRESLKACHAAGFSGLVRGSACGIPLRDGSAHLVLITDVLEHLEDDRKALEEICRVLTPSGQVLITVPAFMALWGLQDQVSHHFRRYRKSRLQALCQQTGFEVVKAFYFNYLLFVPIWMARHAIRILRIDLKSENQVNTPLLNGILTWLFRLDVRTAPVLHPPVGVSCLLWMRKK